MAINTKVLKLWSAVFHWFHGQHFQWMRLSLATGGPPLRSSPWIFIRPPISNNSTTLSYSSFAHCILALNCRYFTMQFTALTFSARSKRISARISQLAVLSIAGHQISQCEDKNKHYVTLYVTVYKAVILVTLLPMLELSLSPASVACNKTFYFLNILLFRKF